MRKSLRRGRGRLGRHRGGYARQDGLGLPADQVGPLRVLAEVAPLALRGGLDATLRALELDLAFPNEFSPCPLRGKELNSAQRDD